MIEGIPLGSLTPSAILGLVVILFLLGKIVPRSSLTDKQEETDRWRSAYEAERDARAKTDKQVERLLEVADTTHSLINAVFANSEQIKRGSGGSDVEHKT